MAGTEGNRGLKVPQRFIVLSETVFGDGAVMVAGSEDGIDADAAVEVLAGAAQVAEIVFGDAAIEEGPVVGGIELGEDVEIFDRVAVAAVDNGLPTGEVEVVLVILGPQREGA